MKLLIVLSLAFTYSAFAELDSCFKDAKSYGNHWHAINSSIECAEAVKSHPERVETKSSDNSVHIYGMKNMFFIEQAGKYELMAGDQTQLANILKFSFNKKKDKLLVIQKNSVSTFRLNFIGNVAPLKHFKSPIVSGVHNVQLLDDQNLLALLSPGKVRIVNADAESRYKEEKFIPKLHHDIVSESLINPHDVAVDSTGKQIYVLDSGRILVFPFSKEKDDKPLKIFSVSEAKSLVFEKNKLLYVKVTGELVEVSLTK